MLDLGFEVLDQGGGLVSGHPVVWTCTVAAVPERRLVVVHEGRGAGDPERALRSPVVFGRGGWSLCRKPNSLRGMPITLIIVGSVRLFPRRRIRCHDY